MAEQKTKPTEQSVESFLDKITDEKTRDDCFALIRLMEKITGAQATMWGGSIVGFGKYHYKYDSGHEGDACLIGFSPRKPNISIYAMPGYTNRTDLVKKLGKHKAGKGCLYIKELEDVDIDILQSILEHSVDFLKKKYPDKK